MAAGPSGVVVLTVIYVLISLSAIIIGARIYLRLAIQKQRLVTADWLRISAWCTAFITGFFDILYAKEGVLHPGINYTLSNWDAPLEQSIRVRKLFPPFMVIRRLIVWIVIVYCICAYIVTISLQLFLCYPIQRNWYFMAIIFKVLFLILVVLVFGLPFFIIHNLNMRRKVKNSGVPSMSISVLSSAAYRLSDRIFIGKESTITFRNRDVLLNPVMPYAGQPRADLKR
ncbi:uncharacterized protein BKA55DRAFT_523625 [Fusarium redolens]|uniref:Uncharacterized protein n=1 Tax=Fusarium redolens TaxID=48865 RepID=A0A9P9JU59_FUSRE|nr:uncharacterized protein BKA55DRAFT_523625 [Fusarium redolens]KAH7232305.1 hypothetical protein BKA55DRAFT_523625 [Fusarium redolens]